MSQLLNQELKLIIVEGRTDKEKVAKLVDEEVEIVCTNGTINVDRLEHLIENFHMDYRDVFILVDEDSAGKKLRKQLSKELPHAAHIYVDKSYREVAATPESELAVALVSSHIMINPDYL
ncbi:toprim domain-containing protein [Gracilibacillus sp. S3-1-1]|uniref:Toprim domain-containing protein n=1 Tax=Gracilibacillus pellucidus TaxID=3095368 RepID=A0ACC6M1G3_9BACI|nr:toprim domain-containing protein [Gracilibacillus sp. S3-1-1]MDX8044720.1 toprim domain-containing protein [Gracilibacillus sp. S3-1-1]